MNFIQSSTRHQASGHGGSMIYRFEQRMNKPCAQKATDCGLINGRASEIQQQFRMADESHNVIIFDG